MSHFQVAQNIAKRISGSPRIIRFFPNTDLRSGHRGLSAAALKHDIDVHNLKSGEFLAFSNRKQTDMKIYAPCNVLLHVKSPHGRLDLRVVGLIPKFFNGRRFDYLSALKDVIKEKVL